MFHDYVARIPNELDRSKLDSIAHSLFKGSHYGCDHVYADMVRDVVMNGNLVENRTGVDTISKFGSHYVYDANPLPILTTKRIHLKSVVGELVWFLRG